MNFFDQQHWAILIALALFPRLTLLLGSFATGGFLWWLGWLFTPHLLVAILALPYWNENPVLVIVAWIWGICATICEWDTVKS